jgi:aspartate--ammonia ligase
MMSQEQLSGRSGCGSGKDTFPVFEGVPLPAGYTPYLNLLETERAIRFIKTQFQNRLASALNLDRISAPLFVSADSGVNDYLNGVEQPVSFFIRSLERRAEIVQSLAKWKRQTLADYGFEAGHGLYTDMNAIRPDERPDNLHSIYVDQWDWEKVITREERNLEFLKSVVRLIYKKIRETEKEVCERFESLPTPYLPEEIRFVHSVDLQRRYPHLAPVEREREVCREMGAVFIIGIGAELDDGKPHDGRAADYDDWVTETEAGKRGLNGDIIVWFETLQCPMELSSMGIRVDEESLAAQLKIKGESGKLALPWHRRLTGGELPLTIGGGIGQSRLCMFLLRKAHIGEVQASIWPEGVIKECRARKIALL